MFIVFYSLLSCTNEFVCYVSSQQDKLRLTVHILQLKRIKPQRGLTFCKVVTQGVHALSYLIPKPGDIRQCREAFLIVATGTVLFTSSM